MIFEIKCTVVKGEGKKAHEQILTAQASARNPKGALRLFLLNSDELDAFDGQIKKLEVEAKPDMVRKGFLGESVEKKEKKAPAKKATKAEPAEATPAE